MDQTLSNCLAEASLLNVGVLIAELVARGITLARVRLLRIELVFFFFLFTYRWYICEKYWNEATKILVPKIH